MTNSIQRRLLRWAGIFLLIYSIILTLSPAVRERSWDVTYRFTHWGGLITWGILIYIAHHVTTRNLQDHDPYIFPAAALLSGWGLLTIWRLDESFGLKQTTWLTISMLVFIAAMRAPHNLSFLRRYKYVLLVSGLILTAFTIFFGTNPLGIGPRLWLGVLGVYFQPSEPLKLLLVIYLAAYFADRPPTQLSALPLFIPTITLSGLALILLLVQRDLGTASIFIFIYTIMLFLATGKRRVLLISVLVLTTALLVGYFYVDIIHARVIGWINPWDDPSGRSYQIVQSLLAVANGGTIGRGPGMGSPLLVPVAISDFIFAAISEESGLVGTLGLLTTIWLILARGIIIAMRAADRFRRLLAAGITTYVGVQSLLIIGGNLRVLPLTGVTLPFVSYGGSSLLTSFVAVLILLIISTPEDSEPAALPDHKSYTLLAGLLGVGLAITALTSAWWAIARGPDLLNRTDNARRAISDRYVPRGEIVDRNNQPINITEGTSGSYARVYLYPDLAPITGYTHPVFGQAGLEASVDDYLRGLKGNPSSLLWWEHLLYGTPPPGLDVRISIDLALQTKADQLLGGHPGAILLMNAETGEILVMASHPTYDPNKLDEEGANLAQNLTAPLVNRATQGLYPAGTTMLPWVQARYGETQPSDDALRKYFKTLGFYQAPAINLPSAFDNSGNAIKDLRVSPLQMALAASALTNHGTMPVPHLSMAVNAPEQGWVVLAAEGEPTEIMQARAADEAALAFIVQGKPYWSHVGQASANDTVITWLVSGTLPNWGGTPLALVVTLEENNIFLAEYIREQLLGTIAK